MAIAASGNKEHGRRREASAQDDQTLNFDGLVKSCKTTGSRTQKLHVTMLNRMKVIEKELGVPIPEMDYPKLAMLNGSVRYLA